jgi:hypothetical protein
VVFSCALFAKGDSAEVTGLRLGKLGFAEDALGTLHLAARNNDGRAGLLLAEHGLLLYFVLEEEDWVIEQVHLELLFASRQGEVHSVKLG